MIDAAVFAGADAVKFQAAVPELVTTKYAQKQMQFSISLFIRIFSRVAPYY